MLRIKCAIALCRCYRESGDFNAAIEVGERVLAQLAGTPLDSSDEAVQMAVTLAGAYFYARRHRPGRPHLPQGDRQGRGPRLPDRARRGVLERQRLRVGAGLGQQRRAHGRAGPGPARRRPGRPQPRPAAHHSSARCSSELDPPDVAEAQRNLDKAAEELAWCSASTVEIAGNELARARAFFLEGDMARRRGHLRRATCRRSRLERPDARGGRAVAAGSDRGSRAVTSRAPRRVPPGGLLLDRRRRRPRRRSAVVRAGQTCSRTSVTSTQPREAYRSAAASAGLRARPVSKFAASALMHRELTRRSAAQTEQQHERRSAHAWCCACRRRLPVAAERRRQRRARRDEGGREGGELDLGLTCHVRDLPVWCRFPSSG